MKRVHGGVDKRVAWLLASSRIHAADPDLAHRDRFVPALNELGIAADQARVSRWESGSQRVPDRVVAAYEQILGLAPGKISAPIYGLRRSLEPFSRTSEVVTTTPETIHRELDALFERAYDGPDGSAWLGLTNYLAVHPNIYLRPDTWIDLSDRLTGEMIRSTGAAFTRRFEALRTLICHPGAQPHVVYSIGTFVTDPDAQTVIYPLTLLQEVTNPKAQELVLRLLGTSSGMLQQGAAWVAAAKLARGHFDKAEQRQLEGIALLMLAAGPRSTRDVDILDVAMRLPEDAQRRIERAVRESAAHKPLETLLDTGEVLPEEVTRHVSVSIAGIAQAATPPPYRIEPDTMLQRLIREALFHGHQEKRHQASVMLTVSPYRAGVAQACAEAMTRRDDVVAQRAGVLMRYLATEAERSSLVALARDGSRPRVRGHAMIALGRLEHGLDQAEEAAVVEVLESSDKRPTQRACLYALGMSGSSHLERLAESDDDYQRRVARWWRRIGSAIHEPSTICGQN